MKKINGYIPILRTKRAEFVALTNLMPEAKSLITPLFELRKMSNQDIEAGIKLKGYIEVVAKRCAECWADNEPVMFDTPGLSNEQGMGASNAALFFYNELEAYGMEVIPTITTDRSSEFCRSLRKVSDTFCLRIFLDDLETPQATADALTTHLRALAVTSKHCHLLIDTKCSDNPSNEDIVESVSQLTDLIDISSWASLTVSGCSFPEDMTGVPKHQKKIISRREVDRWIALNESSKLIGAQAKFGDYTIINPLKPEIDGMRIKNIASKIRYALEKEWVIFRGESPEDREDKYDEYQELAHMVVNDSSFKGADFSWGDQHIVDCSTGKKRICGLEKWIQIDINHHITLVAEQVADSFFD